MTKADIVADIAVETGLERAEALKAVESFMTSIKSSLSKGENVYLRGFGSFIVKERAEKQVEIFLKIQQSLFLLTTFLHLNLQKRL